MVKYFLEQLFSVSVFKASTPIIRKKLGALTILSFAALGCSNELDEGSKRYFLAERPANYQNLKRVTLWFEVDQNQTRTLDLTEKNYTLNLNKTESEPGPNPDLDSTAIAQNSKIDVIQMPESGDLVVINEQEGQYQYTPAKDFDGIDQIETVITDRDGQQVIGIIKLLVKITVFRDSFERNLVIDESTREAFAWSSLFEDKDEKGDFKEKHLSPLEMQTTPFDDASEVDACFKGICAQILQSNNAKDGSDKNQPRTFGPVADGQKALFFWGRKGSSIHNLHLMSKPFDLTNATHAMFGFSALIMDIGDLKKPEKSLNQRGEGEYFKVQVCVDSLRNCGILDQFQYDRKNLQNSQVWHTIFEPVAEYGGENPKKAEGNGLNGRNHTIDQWLNEKVHINLKKFKAQFPNFDTGNVVFRFQTRLQDGFSKEGDLSSDIEDGVALDNIHLTTYRSQDESGLDSIFGQELEHILNTTPQ